jgi:hypothetical protein
MDLPPIQVGSTREQQISYQRDAIGYALAFIIQGENNTDENCEHVIKWMHETIKRNWEVDDVI